MKRSKEDLLESLIAKEAQPDRILEEEDNLPAISTHALVTQVEGLPEARAVMEELLKLLPPGENPDLTEIFRFAFFGISMGFAERALSPYVPEHMEIIPQLLADIRAVYEQVQAAGVKVSREEFFRQAYDFGLHKAYYLDWNLYMSKEMY